MLRTRAIEDAASGERRPSGEFWLLGCVESAQLGGAAGQAGARERAWGFGPGPVGGVRRERQLGKIVLSIP